jgi:hypothetical protein
MGANRELFAQSGVAKAAVRRRPLRLIQAYNVAMEAIMNEDVWKAKTPHFAGLFWLSRRAG